VRPLSNLRLSFIKSLKLYHLLLNLSLIRQAVEEGMKMDLGSEFRDLMKESLKLESGLTCVLY
jgi:hypothetical protein